MASTPRLPRLPRASGSDPGPLKPETWNRLCDYVESLEARIVSLRAKESPDIGIRSTGDGFTAYLKRRPGAVYPQADPFAVYLARGPSSTWVATVAPGLVIERVTTDADAIIAHEPVGITSGGEPVQHTVGANQSLVVKVATLDTGAVGAESGNAVEIAVVATSTASTHYIPNPVGDQAEGAAGTYYYVLADFVVEGEGIGKVSKREGSHIDHWRELPMFVKEYGDHDIFYKYDQPTGIYKTKGLTAKELNSLKSIKIEDLDGGELLFSTNGGDLDLTVKHLKLEAVGSTDTSVSFELSARTVSVNLTLPDMTGVTSYDDAGSPVATENLYTGNGGDPEHNHSVSINAGVAGTNHNHTVTITGTEYTTGVAIDLPAETLTATVSLPNAPTLVASTTPDYVLCWRQGLFAGSYTAETLPAGSETVVQKTIYVIEEPPPA